MNLPVLVCRMSGGTYVVCVGKRKPVDRPNISYVVQKIDQIMKVSTIGSVGSFSRHRHRNLPDPVSQLGKLSLILTLTCLSQMK